MASSPVEISSRAPPWRFKPVYALNPASLVANTNQGVGKKFSSRILWTVMDHISLLRVQGGSYFDFEHIPQLNQHLRLLLKEKP